MNNHDQNNELDELYKARKEQFKAPKSSKFQSKRAQAFWKSYTFYSSLAAFSLALVVVLPMMNSPLQSDLIIVPQTATQEAIPQMRDRLKESNVFEAEAVMSKSIQADEVLMDVSEEALAPSAMAIEPEEMQREAIMLEAQPSNFAAMSEKKKIDPCERKKIASSYSDSEIKEFAGNAEETDTQYDIECP